MSSRSTAIGLPDTQSICMFPWESLWKILHAYSGRSRAHLTVSTEWVSSQTNKSCLCKSSSPFTMGLYGSPYDYVIHVAIIATLRIALITSFQPPLTLLGSTWLHLALLGSTWHFYTVHCTVLYLTDESIASFPALPHVVLHVTETGRDGNEATKQHSFS